MFYPLSSIDLDLEEYKWRRRCIFQYNQGSSKLLKDTEIVNTNIYKMESYYFCRCSDEYQNHDLGIISIHLFCTIKPVWVQTQNTLLFSLPLFYTYIIISLNNSSVTLSCCTPVWRLPTECHQTTLFCYQSTLDLMEFPNGGCDHYLSVNTEWLWSCHIRNREWKLSRQLAWEDRTGLVYC